MNEKGDIAHPPSSTSTMQVSFGQLLMIGIVLYFIDKYIDHKIQRWTDYYLHLNAHSGGNRRGLDHFAPYPSANTVAMDPTDASTLRSGLEPLYGAGRVAVPLSSPHQDATLPQQAWIQSEQQKQWDAQETLPEPQRAFCHTAGNTPIFHPITSHDVPYTVSLHADNGDFSQSCNIRPLSADSYPMGMGSIQQAQELSPQQLATRSTDRAFVDQYIQSLDDRTSTRATQDFVPYTAQW